MHANLNVLLLSLCGAVFASAPSGPWDAFNLAPSSRTVYPAKIFTEEGNVGKATNLINGRGPATLSGNGSWVTLDFGKEVGGIISINFDAHEGDAAIAVAWTESPLFISPLQSDSSSNIVNGPSDGVLAVPAPLPTGFWIQDPTRLRGGFRYLTLSLTAGDSVTLSNVSCAISFQPGVKNLRDYSGHFYALDPASDDKDFLTKVWYSGAYTAQTNIIEATQGRQSIPSSEIGWLNNGTIGVASPVAVDGAKRGRTIWPGDLGIAVATDFLALNSVGSTRNSVIEMFVLQNAEGALPYCGPTISCGATSITYHEWSLISVYNYWLYTDDLDWVRSIWSNYSLAVNFLATKVDAGTGLVNSTGMADDWNRDGGGGLSISPNVLYYKVLLGSVELANALKDHTFIGTWATSAAAIKQAIQTHLWNSDLGMFVDNTTSALTPQDGNSFAVVFNVTVSDEQKQSISAKLPRNWQETGAVTPERVGTIVPFIGGFELQAHWEVGQGERALDLIRLQWGFMLTTNISVQSTLLEGWKVDDPLNYYGIDPGYTSHSHGWSSGPTSALTFYLVGLRPVTPVGRTWQLAPQLSGLPAAQGSFETTLGRFMASWSNSESSFELHVTTPAGTSGAVILPVKGRTVVDGIVTAVPSSRIKLSGGTHSITVIS